MITKFTHKSGLQVVIEKMDSPAISMNLYIGVGSLNEDSSNRGISHFLEHMLFNGTKTRNKQDLSSHIENIGASNNAYTSYEETAITFTCMPNNFEECIDTMFDMAFNTVFEAEAIENERKIILQEIQDRRTSLSGISYEQFVMDMWNQNKQMESPIIGTTESVEKITKLQLQDYYDEHYIPSKMILSIAGNFDDMDMVNQVLNKYCNLFNSKPKKNHVTLERDDPHMSEYFSTFDQDSIYVDYELNFDSFREYTAARLLNTILGSGSSSMLFQKIREEKGLVYGIGSYISNISQNYSIIINTQCMSDKTEEILLTIPDVIDELSDITEERLQYAKNRTNFGLAQSHASTSLRVGSNSFCIDNDWDIMTFEESKELVDSITLQEVKDLYDEVFSKQPTIVVTTKEV